MVVIGLYGSIRLPAIAGNKLLAMNRGPRPRPAVHGALGTPAPTPLSTCSEPPFAACRSRHPTVKILYTLRALGLKTQPFEFCMVFFRIGKFPVNFSHMPGETNTKSVKIFYTIRQGRRTCFFNPLKTKRLGIVAHFLRLFSLIAAIDKRVDL